MVKFEKIEVIRLDGYIFNSGHYVELTLKPTKPVSYEGNRGYNNNLCSLLS